MDFDLVKKIADNVHKRLDTDHRYGYNAFFIFFISKLNKISFKVFMYIF